MNYENTASKILEAIGGKDNVSNVVYCMTRLRIAPKDRSLIDDEAINQMEGIVGTRTVGSQYQIIIGPDVEHVYKAFCKQGGFEEVNMLKENLDPAGPKKKLTFKSILDNVMDVIGACVAPMLPIITAAGLLKLIVAIVGPTMLGLLPETSDFIRLLTLVGDAGFYFFPVYVAYSSAKKFNTNIPMALFIAGVLLHPSLIDIVNAGEAFHVYGLPMTLTTYSSNFISMLLITWVMSYVEKGVNKVVPKSLRALLYPLLMILIMLPLALCIFGPLGSIIGKGIATGIVAVHNFAGPVAIAIVAALWPLLIVTGMHQALIAVALSYIATYGFDESILVGAFVSNYPLFAIGLAYLLMTKTPEDRSYAGTSLITLAIGGISEPTLFGILLKYKKAILYMMIGGFAGGLYAGIMKVCVYFVGVGNFLVCLGFAGERVSSLPQGIISCVIAFVITFALCLIFKFDNGSKKLNKK